MANSLSRRRLLQSMTLQQCEEVSICKSLVCCLLLSQLSSRESSSCRKFDGMLDTWSSSAWHLNFAPRPPWSDQSAEPA